MKDLQGAGALQKTNKSASGYGAKKFGNLYALVIVTYKIITCNVLLPSSDVLIAAPIFCLSHFPD